MVHDPYGVHRLRPAQRLRRRRHAHHLLRARADRAERGQRRRPHRVLVPGPGRQDGGRSRRQASRSSIRSGRSTASSNWRSSRIRGAPRSRWSEDAEWPGFHHLHLRSTDPAAALDWYENLFAGERDSLKGRIAGLRYGTVWLLISRHEGRAGSDRGTSVRSPGLAVPRPARRRRGDQGQGRRVHDRAASVHQPARRGHADPRSSSDRTGSGSRSCSRGRSPRAAESSAEEVTDAQPPTARPDTEAVAQAIHRERRRGHRRGARERRRPRPRGRGATGRQRQLRGAIPGAPRGGRHAPLHQLRRRRHRPGSPRCTASRS